MKKEKNKNNGDASRERLIPVRDWQRIHGWPPESGLRYLIFNADKNGFSKVIRHVGRRVLIKESEFFRWIDEQEESHRQAKRFPRR